MCSILKAAEEGISARQFVFIFSLVQNPLGGSEGGGGREGGRARFCPLLVLGLKHIKPFVQDSSRLPAAPAGMRTLPPAVHPPQCFILLCSISVLDGVSVDK